MSRKQSDRQLLLARALRSTDDQLTETIEVFTAVLKGRKAAAKPPAEKKPRTPRGSKKKVEVDVNTGNSEPVN